jgi:AcrR family transcriptional regulator
MRTLAEDKQQATVNRILAAGRQALVAQGPDVTMEEIAAYAGTSRRTLFRYFPSRDSLLAAAHKSGMRRYGERLPPYEGGEWTSWLADLCDVVHQKNATYDLGYFELTARRDLTGELAAVEARRKQAYRVTMSRLAQTLWSAAGGIGSPPTAVPAAMAAHLSAHFTAAVTNDAGEDWRRAAELAQTAITAVVQASLRA